MPAKQNLLPDEKTLPISARRFLSVECGLGSVPPVHLTIDPDPHVAFMWPIGGGKTLPQYGRFFHN